MSLKEHFHGLRMAGLLLVGGLTAVAAPDNPYGEGPAIPSSLDLDTALKFALEHSFEIRQAQERIREQEGLIIEVKSLALPNASIGSSYTKHDSALDSDRGGNSSSTQDWRVALQVRQTLYAGGGVKAALDAQKAVRTSALAELEASIHSALLQVRINFYSVLLAREQIKVQEQNVKLVEEQYQTAKNRFDAGASSNFEVLRAEVALANAKPALIRARNSLRIAIDELRQSMGYVAPRSEAAARVPDFVGELSYTPSEYNLGTSLATALEKRPELRSIEALVVAREAGIRNAKSNYRPDLALIGGYEWRKNGNSERVRESLDGWNVGLSSSWAIFDGRATKGRVVQAKSKFEQTRISAAQVRLAIEVEVRQAVSRVQEAAELAEAASKVVAQAEEALRLADARYSAGTATQLDVLTARVDLTQSRTNQLQANYSYLVALAQIRTAMGLGEAITGIE